MTAEAPRDASLLVAAKHDLQTRDAHFEVAIRGGARVGVGRDGATPPDNGLSPESQAFSENRWKSGS